MVLPKLTENRQLDTLAQEKFWVVRVQDMGIFIPGYVRPSISHLYVKDNYDYQFFRVFENH